MHGGAGFGITDPLKAIQLLIESELPEDLRDPHRVYDSKSIGSLLGEVAKRYPDRYKRIVQHIGDVGRNASYRQGETLGLSDLLPVIDKQAVFKQMDAEVEAARRDAVNDEDFEHQRMAIWNHYNDQLEKVTSKAAMKAGNSLAYAVVSGARGKSPQLKAMLTTPGLFEDYKGNTIPMFVRHSFGEGLRPAEFLASTFGARKSVISTKTCLRVGTLVKMRDGTDRRIEDIKPGETVWGSDAEGNLSPVKVLRVIDQGMQDVNRFTFRFSNGEHTLILDATDNHKLLANTLRKYSTQAVQVHRGSRGAVDPSVYHEKIIERLGTRARAFSAVLSCSGTAQGLAEPWALLLGLLAGDGCTTSSRVEFSCADPSLVDDILPYLTGLGLKIQKSKGENFSWDVTTLNYRAVMNGGIVRGVQNFQATGPSVPLTKKMVESGMHGKYAYQKTVPPEIWNWDDASVAAYVGGMFATAGSVHITEQSSGRNQLSISLASTSEALLCEVKNLLSFRFGIQTGRVSETTKGGFGDTSSLRKHMLYSFNIGQYRGVEKFMQRIPLMGKKGPQLKELFSVAEEKQRNPYSKAKLIKKEVLGQLPCFDLEVDNVDHLFVLSNGLIVSNSTAKGGDFSKIATQATAPLVVTTKDCGVHNGIELPIDEPSLKGRVLARAAGKFPTGTTLDSHALAELRKSGTEDVIARSSLTCQAPEGVCAKCVGQWAGKFPHIGDSVGITASNAIGEPITQGALNQKHTSGMSSGKKEFSGFDAIDQFTASPENFPDRAAVAEHAGKVTKVEPAAQGGHYVHIGEDKHYVLPGYEVTAKPGDDVEAGDQLSDGLVDPGDIVRLRGIGEGRKYYVDRLSKILSDSGMPADRRNVEMMARASMNHVVIDDPEGLGDYLPDDVANYSRLSATYTPPESSKTYEPKDSVEKYLQVPALHYTIGTQVTPRIAKHLEKFGPVLASEEAPGFRPEMTNLRTASHEGQDDWLAQMHTSHLKAQLSDSAARGRDANTQGSTHFAGPLARGQGFATNVETTGHF